MGGRGTDWARRLVAALLLGLPRHARLRYGEEIVDTVMERTLRRRRSHGRLAASWLYLHECAGLLTSGVLARASQRPPAYAIDTRGAKPMDLIWHETRLAARALLRRPALTVPALLTLTLGIGAYTAIFSVFHAVLLRPLPFDAPDRLVTIYETNPERGWVRAQVAAANFLDWRERATSFDDVAAWEDWLSEAGTMVAGEPRLVQVNKVTGNFFHVLGVRPLYGDTFSDQQTWAGSGSPIVLSHAYWSEQMGADPGVVGRALDLDGTPHTVAAVMPASFALPLPFRDADLWMPTAWAPERRQQASFRRAHGLRTVGRLADGADIDDASAELAHIAGQLETEYPETNRLMGSGVMPLHEWVVGDSRTMLEVLLLAVGFVLVIGCANVANMLLARAAGRRQEMAVRQTLGGSRRRLVLQGLLESLLLAACGGAAGLALGAASIHLLLAASPSELLRVDSVGIDPVVALSVLATALAAGLVFGAVPAWRGASVEPRAAGSGRSTPHRRSLRTSKLLVAAEVALTLPLLVATCLVVRTVANLSSVEPGFDSDGVLVAQVSLPGTRYDSYESAARFYRSLLDEVGSLPGAEAVAMSTRLPFVDQRWSSDFTADGWPAERYGVGVRHDEVSPGMFDALGIPILRGRDFTQDDGTKSELVVIVNHALADEFFPSEDPIGRRIAFDRVAGEGSVWRTIVGVVGDVRRESLAAEEEPSFYAPVLQDTTRSVFLLVRTTGDPLALVQPARERLRTLDPAMPLYGVTTLEQVVTAATARERFLLILLSVFAIVAAALAGTGIFGVAAYATSRRMREMGIRMALGACRRSVMALVLGRGLLPVLAGLALGVAAAAALVQGLSSFLYQVQPIDPLSFAAAVLGLLALATLACAAPARWATRADPARALRSE